VRCALSSTMWDALPARTTTSALRPSPSLASVVTPGMSRSMLRAVPSSGPAIFTICGIFTTTVNIAHLVNIGVPHLTAKRVACFCTALYRFAPSRRRSAVSAKPSRLRRLPRPEKPATAVTALSQPGQTKRYASGLTRMLLPRSATSTTRVGPPRTPRIDFPSCIRGFDSRHRLHITAAQRHILQYYVPWACETPSAKPFAGVVGARGYDPAMGTRQEISGWEF
jgi:hypothetical protein